MSKIKIDQVKPFAKARIHWNNGNVTAMYSRPLETPEQFKERLLRNEILIANKTRIEYMVNGEEGYYIN
jgi:hypothetical protein